MLKLLAIATICGITLAATKTQAQGYYYYNQAPNYGYNSGYNTPYGNNLGQSVYALDQYGDQMTYLFSIEARGHCGCRNSAALLAEMRRYNCHTNNLIAAFSGSCPTTFKKRACTVRESLSRIQCLRKKVRVSSQVCGLISRSCPIATHVHRNASLFRPVTHYSNVPSSGVHHHHSSHKRDFDIGSAIVGAIAGRIIHGAINNNRRCR